MPIKFITEVIKGVFGVSGTAEEQPAAEGTNITVERETDDTEDVAETADSEEPAQPTADDEDETDDGIGDAADVAVAEVNGIGPTYSDRLTDAGIDTVAALADANAEEVAEAAQVSESRATDWISQAVDW